MRAAKRSRAPERSIHVPPALIPLFREVFGADFWRKARFDRRPRKSMLKLCTVCRRWFSGYLTWDQDGPPVAETRCPECKAKP